LLRSAAVAVCFRGSLISAVGKRVSAENLLGSLLRVARYSDVANEGVDLEIKKGDLLRVRLHYSGVARHSDVHQIEFWMASVVRICRTVIGANFKPLEVRIAH